MPYLLHGTWWAFHLPEGFQIVHVQKQQCLFLNEKVVVGSCNGTSQNQQWRWTQDGKLLHAKSAQCLAVSNISGGPSRAVTVTSCSQAPWWTCYEQEGFLEMENASFFLKKQGPRVVVKKGKKYLHSWMKIDVNTEGKLVNGSLCLKKGELFIPPFIVKGPSANTLCWHVHRWSPCPDIFPMEDFSATGSGLCSNPEMQSFIALTKINQTFLFLSFLSSLAYFNQYFFVFSLL